MQNHSSAITSYEKSIRKIETFVKSKMFKEKKELNKKTGGIAVWIETFRVRTYMLFRGAVLVAEQARQTYADGETSVRRLP